MSVVGPQSPSSLVGAHSPGYSPPTSHHRQAIGAASAGPNTATAAGSILSLENPGGSSFEAAKQRLSASHKKQLALLPGQVSGSGSGAQMALSAGAAAAVADSIKPFKAGAKSEPDSFGKTIKLAAHRIDS